MILRFIFFRLINGQGHLQTVVPLQQLFFLTVQKILNIIKKPNNPKSYLKNTESLQQSEQFVTCFFKHKIFATHRAVCYKKCFFLIKTQKSHSFLGEVLTHLFFNSYRKKHKIYTEKHRTPGCLHRKDHTTLTANPFRSDQRELDLCLCKHIHLAINSIANILSQLDLLTNVGTLIKMV